MTNSISKILCSCGCGREAQHQFKNGNWCCESNISKCPAIREKNSKSHKQITGWTHSEETKNKMSLSQKGRKLTEEHKNKLRGPKSDEHKRKLSESRMGIEPWNKGKTNIYSQDTRDSISNSLKQYFAENPQQHTDETKDKIRQAHIGRQFSDSHKKHISQSKKGVSTGACSEETRLKMSIAASGERSSQWRGGIAYEPYCPAWGDKEYKQSIKERDGHVCQNPYCWNKDDRIVIHHIDYNKKNCSPSNLITVCSSCNTRANTNRKYWIKIYQECIRRI